QADRAGDADPQDPRGARRLTAVRRIGGRVAAIQRRFSRDTTAAMITPSGPSTEQRRNQKQPPRPFEVAIHAPRTPHTSHTGPITSAGIPPRPGTRTTPAAQPVESSAKADDAAAAR